MEVAALGWVGVVILGDIFKQPLLVFLELYSTLAFLRKQERPFFPVRFSVDTLGLPSNQTSVHI